MGQCLVGWWSVVNGLVEDLPMSRWVGRRTVGGSVEDLSVGRWSVACRWSVVL